KRRQQPANIRNAEASAEEQRGKVGEVAAPDHPSVCAGCFDVGVVNSFGREPVAEIAIEVDEMVVGAASDPEQAELLIGFGIERENVWFTVAERHDDQHRLSVALRDEIIEDYVGAAGGGPRAGVVTESVEQIQDGISLFAPRIVAGRSINKKAAVIAYHGGL